MAQGISSYGGGGAPATTRTEINQGPAGPSGFYDASFMNFLQRRRGPQGNPSRPEVQLPTANERALDDAKTQALLAQYKAESEPPPMQYTAGGFNIGPPHLEMDINHMSGAQRAKYLPQNSGMVPFENKAPSSIEEDVRKGVGPSGNPIYSEQDKDALEGGMVSSRGANAGDVRRQQYIKDRALQDYYGTGGAQSQRDGAPNQYGSGRG